MPAVPSLCNGCHEYRMCNPGRLGAPIGNGVIPGWPEGRNPESVFQRPVFMDSGFAAARRPGIPHFLLLEG